MARQVENELFDTPETLPAEPQELEVGRVLTEDDPEVRVARYEKIADLSPRMNKALWRILLSETFPQDWHVFEDKKDPNKSKVCLCSAGAERVGRNFPIKFFEVSSKKETFTDAIGPAYRYVFEGKAVWGERVVFSQGNFSTRDKYLSFTKADGWKSNEEINEGSIRNAAYHIFCGNAIKCMLGLRGIPKPEFDRIMKELGRDPSLAGSHSYAEGTKGGTSAGDTEKQQELAKLCIAIADAGQFPTTRDGGKTYTLEPAHESLLKEPPLELAKEVCKILSGFMGRDEKWVEGRPASQLRGRWLNTTLANARKVSEGGLA
jgi:hypothetical protein